MKVGFSSVVITPDLSKRKKPLQLGGYSPRKYCSGVHDDLYARAVYFEGNEEEKEHNALLICCDLLSIDGAFAEMVKKHISRHLPIRPNNILISATHTHHGPDFRGMFRKGGYLAIVKGFLFPKPESKELQILGKNLIKVAKKAYETRKKAKIGVGQSFIAEKDRVMLNRRDPFNREKSQYPVTVIKVISDENENEGNLYGIIINYACHGTVLPYQNTLITADYVGYMINYLEIRHPDLIGNIIYFNGPCGDINPVTKKLKAKMLNFPDKVSNSDIYQQVGTFEDAKYVGETIAKNALNIFEKTEPGEDNEIRAITKKVYIPVKDYDYDARFRSALMRLFYKLKIRLFSLLAKLKILKSNIFFQIENLSKQGSVQSQVQLINLSKILILTSPGEYFLELGNEVIEYGKVLFPNKTIFVVELANDSIGYLYTVEAYLEGGYESSFSIIPLGGRFITMKLKKLLSDFKTSISQGN